MIVRKKTASEKSSGTRVGANEGKKKDIRLLNIVLYHVRRT